MAGRTGAPIEARVAVLVDCDNTSPEVLVVEAVKLVAADAAAAKVHLGPLGQYLLTLQQEAANDWTARLAPPHEAAAATVFNDIVASNGT